MSNIKNVHWFPGHMKKTTNKLEEQVKLVDFVIVLLDSRIPLSSRNELLEKIVEHKNKLYVLTKIDLSDEEETKKWCLELNKNGNYSIAIDLKNNNSKKIVLDAFNKFSNDKKEKLLKRGIKNVNIRAMVIGIPNVGKSTFINLFASKKITEVGNRAGVTKNVRWVKINNFELLDVPGVLEPSYENKEKAINLALIGSMKESILPLDELAFKCLDFLKTYYLEALNKRYEAQFNENDTNYDILKFIALKRGYLLKNNEIDLDKVETILLNEFRNGKITKFTLERL